MGRRDTYTMVPEDDPQWMRFWEKYPRRCAKKEARKAWMELQPTPPVVDKMLCTLEWQTVEWARDAFRFAPYPASWLRAERFHDDPPPRALKSMSDATASVFATLGIKP